MASRFVGKKLVSSWRLMRCLSQKQLLFYAHWRADISRIFLHQPTWLMTRQFRIPLRWGDAWYIYCGEEARVVEFREFIENIILYGVEMSPSLF